MSRAFSFGCSPSIPVAQLRDSGLQPTSSLVTSRRKIRFRARKGNTLIWRQRAEDGIRANGPRHTIIRTGMLFNPPGGERAIDVIQEALPLSPRYRIARSDVADAFVAALDHARAERATLEVVRG